LVKTALFYIKEATRRTCKKLKLSDNQRWAPTKGKNERQKTPTINSQHQTIYNQEPTTTIDSETRQPQQAATTDRYTRQPTPTPDIQPTSTPDNQQSTTDTNKMQQNKVESNPFMLHRSRT
jgi:hypothetical protein